MAFGKYLIAYIDILGQRELLRQLNGENIIFDDNTKDKLKKTAGTVFVLRDQFFNLIKTVSEPSQEHTSLPARIQDEIKRIAKPTIRFMSFSDTLIFFIPIDESNKLNTLVNIKRVIGALSIEQSGLFSMGTYFRGSIEIGNGIDINENEIYGPVLEEAYLLESKYAEYPRVLIGKRLSKYLRILRYTDQSDNNAEAIINFTMDINNFISTDSDGLRILDFLSYNAMSLYGGANDCKDIYLNGLEKAKQQHSEFISKDNIKLASRYGRLVHYYMTKEHIWIKK